MAESPEEKQRLLSKVAFFKIPQHCSNNSRDLLPGAKALGEWDERKIPKALFTDEHFKAMSAGAKILYGLMLDRMGLSSRNGWLDVDGRVYIYFTLEDAIDMIGVGHNKIVRLFRELDEIGLIERKKQGQGKPTRMTVPDSATLRFCVFQAFRNEELGKKSRRDGGQGVLNVHFNNSAGFHAVNGLTIWNAALYFTWCQ